jgi:hypothetical protein
MTRWRAAAELHVRRHEHVNAYAKYLTLKSAIEDLFGSDAWYALKESNHLGTWRKYGQRTLRAIEVSVKDTVEVCDREWLSELCEQIDRGVQAISKADAIDEIVGILAGTLIEVSFLQIGLMPRRKGRAAKYPLRKGEWKLNAHRSVVYLQTNAQKEALFWSKQQKQIGFDKQLTLQGEYRRSKSEMPYSEWCYQRAKGAPRGGA